jgi:hypothetical protein
LDDFRRLDLVRDGRRRTMRHRLRADKGHRGAWEAFVDTIRGRRSDPAPEPRGTVETTLATLRAVESLALGNPLAVNAEEFLASLSPGR